MVEVNYIHEIKNHRQMALKAMGMFISASYLSPASVSAQGARIAEQCKNQGLYPIDLRLALSTSDDLIELIADKAIRMHTGNSSAPDITNRDVEMIVGFDFAMAEDLMALSMDQIREIYGSIYSDLGKTLDIASREKALKNHIAQLLRNKSGQV